MLSTWWISSLNHKGFFTLDARVQSKLIPLLFFIIFFFSSITAQSSQLRYDLLMEYIYIFFVHMNMKEKK